LARRPKLLVLLGLAVAGLVGVAGYAAWPETYLLRSRNALGRHDYEAARSALDRYLKARPNSAEAHFLLARLDRRSNRYFDSARHLDACQRLGGSPEAIELERALADIQNGVINPEAAKRCFLLQSRHDENEFFILEALSQGLTKIYRLREAMECLDRMLELQPDCNYAYRRRAWIHAQNEQHHQAEADYRSALEIDPEDRVARLGLAQILLDIRKDGQEASKHFERLWTVQQDSSVAVGLAQSWRLLGRGEEAGRLLDGWLASHPGDALALAERGELALDDGRVQHAEKLLRQALALAPYHRDANYALYLCLIRLGRKAEAEAYQERMKAAKKAREQLAILMQRLQQTPHDADLRCEIAQIFLGYGGEEEGVRWLVTNLQNHPRHAKSHLALADYYDKKGDSTSAARHRRLAELSKGQSGPG
jgi:predicted Zn-dependent protease